VLGVRILDVDRPGGWPLERLLFRSRPTQALETLANTGAWRTIGEFLRAVVDLVELVSTPWPLVSPSNQSPAYAFCDGHAAVEQRANAFAACLLVPTKAVRAMLVDRDPTSEDSVVLIASHFGLGRITAINRIRDVFDLSATERERMRTRTPGGWDSDPVADVAEAASVRGGVLRDATLDALARGAIDPRRWTVGTCDDVRSLLTRDVLRDHACSTPWFVSCATRWRGSPRRSRW